MAAVHISVPFVIGRYVLLEMIGAGGMGEVYRGFDQHLERSVAVKVLPSGALANDAERRRLRKEAQTLSKLNHPNIATVHDFDSHAGIDYLVMEYVEGESLSDLLKRGPLNATDFCRLSVQLADGVAAAHKQGVVHCDLKPANVRVTPQGRLKILDFGFAKLLRITAVTSTRTTADLPQASGGTLGYMPIEQLTGQPVDFRTDIFSLGVVLCEMATGIKPSLSSIVSTSTRQKIDPSRTNLSGRVRSNVEKIVRKCLEMEPERRYASGVELFHDLLHATSPSTTWARRAHYDSRRAGRSDTALKDSTKTARKKSPHRPMLAILPLENLTGDSSQEYFVDGLTEEIITEMGHLFSERMGVIARSSIMRYKAKRPGISRVARELRVGYILEGSVRHTDFRLRVAVKLVETSGQTQVWAESYERPMADVFAVQQEIANMVAEKVAIQICRNSATPRRTIDPEAYKLYLNGRHHWDRLSREDFDTALDYFQRAADKDPNCALAYAGIADVWLILGDNGHIPAREARPAANAALAKAIDLDDSHSDIFLSLANCRFTYDWDWNGAECAFRRALELNPNSARARFMYADFLMSMRRFDEAEKEMEWVFQLDPLNYFFQCFQGWHLLYRQRDDEAITQLTRLLNLDGNLAATHLGLWGAYHRKGMDADALTHCRTFFELLGDREILETLNAESRDYSQLLHAAAEKLATRSNATFVPAIRIARLYAQAGSNDDALHWLEKAYAHREPPQVHIGVGWDWDNLRNSSRFQHLLRTLNLP